LAQDLKVGVVYSWSGHFLPLLIIGDLESVFPIPRSWCDAHPLFEDG